MANRSDFNSILPRQTKRMLALQEARGYIKPEQAKTVRKLFIDAHKHQVYVHNRRTVKDVTPAGSDGE